MAQSMDSDSDNAEQQPLLRAPAARIDMSKTDGTASVFASFGVVWSIVALQAYVRWIISPTEFRPAPVLGPDKIEPWRLIALRIFEALSVGVLLSHVWYCIVLPAYPSLQKGRRNLRSPKFNLDGRHVIGGLVALCADGFLNCYEYIFMWNSHSINMGVWAKFLPFHNAKSSSRYGESLLWGPPMYVYFCAGFGILGSNLVAPLRRRFPSLTNAGIFTLIWVLEAMLDFVIENLAIRITQGYGYAKTYGPLTLWAGEQYQFPIYESIFVANLGVVFTYMRTKAYENGISPIERGYWVWHLKLHGTVRTFAVIGFCALSVLTMYHLPLNWLGIIGDSHAKMASYMLPGIH